MDSVSTSDLQARWVVLRKEEKIQFRVVVFFGLFAVGVLIYKLPKLGSSVDLGQWFVPMWVWGTWIYRLLKWHACHVEARILREFHQRSSPEGFRPDQASAPDS